ncbi:MAG TPA: PAS domain S-box protein [Burkholderiales bacterium]|nr:PAS domain S-box protein [Burkholderiales bacterium]
MASDKRSKVEPPPRPEALFGPLFEQFPVGLAIFSMEGRFLHANAVLTRMFGYTVEELMQRNHLEVVHADDREAASLLRAQAISGKSKPRLNERRYVSKAGATIWAQVAGGVVRDSAGTPVYTSAVISDITALKRAARMSEQRFRRMVEMSSDWYWMQDQEFRFVDVPGLEAPDVDTDVVFGKARWEINGLAPMQESWDQHRARLRRLESFSDFVLLRYKTSGELRYLSVSGEPLFDEHGRLRGYHGIGKDITERARDQKALEESEERYRLLFEVHPQAMWVVDANSLAFLAVNGAALGLYGYSREEFFAMTADQIRPEEDVAGLRKAFEERGSEYRQRVWRHRKKNGDLIHVKVVSFNLEFSGRPARLGVIYDVTDQVKAGKKTESEPRRA